MQRDAGVPTNDLDDDRVADSAIRSHPQLAKATVVTVSLLLITLAVNLQVPLYKSYAEVAGYGSGLIAVTFAGYVVGLIPVLILLGGISDRIGRKPTMLLGLSAALLANLLIIWDPSMQMLLKVRVLQGIAVGLSLGAATAYLAEILDHSEKVASIAGITVAVGLGSGSLLTSTALLFQDTLVPMSYIGVTTVTALCLIAMLFMPASRGERHKNMIRLPYISRDTTSFCAAIFLSWSLTGVIIATIPGELERLGFTGWSGLLVFLAIGTGALCQPIARGLAPSRALSLGYFLLILAYCLLIYGVWAQSLVVILLAATCSGASSFGFIYLGGLAEVVRSSGTEKARAVSGYFLFAYLGLGLPCILIGYLADETGLLTALTGFGSTIAVISVAAFTVFSHSKKSAYN